MEKLNGKTNKQLIEATKERLQWYTLEATDEEFDEEEVDALVELLNKLEPLEVAEEQASEAALERFRSYAEMREAEAGLTEGDAERRNESGIEAIGQVKGEATKTTEATVYGNAKKNGGLYYFVRAHKFVAVAAALFIIILITGGSLGAVSATKGEGFFHWLKKDDEGVTLMTSPERIDGDADMENEKKYKSLEEVPEEYKQYMVWKDEIERLKDFELQSITMSKFKSYSRICERLIAEDGRFVCFGVFIYQDRVLLSREGYFGEKKGEQEGVLLRENPEGEKDRKIYFYIENEKYFVEGDIDAELLEDLAEIYRDMMLGK